MMLYPMLWNDTDHAVDVFDEMDREMNNFWNGFFGTTSSMKTDVVDEGDHYRVDAELPGYQKDEIHLDLKDGSLVIAAEHKNADDQKDKEGNYLRRERSYINVKRSFYVGKDVKPEDIKASYENGVLSINVPKKDAAKIENNASHIAIE